MCARHKPVIYRHDSTYRTDSWHRRFLSPIHRTVRYEKTRVSRKCKGTSLWNFFRTLNLKILPRQVAGVINRTRRRSSLLTTPAAIDASWLDAHHLPHDGRPMPSLHCFDSLWICCTNCSQCCAAVDKISTDVARRAVRLQQQSFLSVAVRRWGRRGGAQAPRSRR